ncbi:MAG: polymerase subunit epsilon [Frankiaceae bacterium]|nr:polymerase subunit epsilon [Frankiaceae bacterium]
MTLTTRLDIPVQCTFDELGTPLRDQLFVVVDLETTGGSPASSGITEIGAVKVRGGEVLGEFQTLVNPGTPIPPFIAVLTGITNSMVAAAPRIEAVLPAFLEFARGSVLVAHNSPFDVGFLKAACLTHGQPWPGFDSLDTARLARRVLTRDEAPNCKLGTLARLFRTAVRPCHRALADAQATVDVLHGLIERLGNLGVSSVEELRTYSAQVPPEQRRKRYLADGLPHLPGVYIFRDGRGRVLYIGKSKDLRSRVRNYFVASEPRTRMAEMVSVAERVDHIVCTTALEAEIRELRLIAEHKPRYNRRSRFPEKSVFVKLTSERFPRLSLVRKVLSDDAHYLGPFSSARSAEQALAAIHDAIPLRQCTPRLSERKPITACVLAEIGKCGAPCDGSESPDAYAAHVAAYLSAAEGDPARIVDGARRRIDALVHLERFEEAAAHRDRASAFVRAAARFQRLASLAGCAELLAARATSAGGWEIALIRHGRFVGACVSPPGAAPRPYADALVAAAEHVSRGHGPTPAASAEEMHLLLRWLDEPGTRLVELDGVWASPAFGAAGRRDWLEARESATPLDDRRALRPDHRPARSTFAAAG